MKETLEAYGFHEEWVQWIMNITSTPFFSILLNGAPTKKLQHSRGIRQGDPLSPFLFILMVEGLSRVIKEKVEKREFRGMNLYAYSKFISHQQFMDDTMFMGHSSTQKAWVLKKFLNYFYKASDLEVNNSNSQLFFFNMPRIHQQNILCILGFQGISLPSKYLGASLVEGVIKKVYWEYYWIE